MCSSPAKNSKNPTSFHKNDINGIIRSPTNPIALPSFCGGTRFFPPKFCCTLTVRSKISGLCTGGLEGSMSKAWPANKTSGSSVVVVLGLVKGREILNNYSCFINNYLKMAQSLTNLFRHVKK